MTSEIRQCQNCKQDFTLEADDFSFFEMMKVPAETLCPDCRLQQRLAFRNERNLYRRKDSKTGKDILSIYSPEKDFKVYEQSVWHGDSWDPTEYGRDVDFSRPLFQQIKELMHDVPFASLNNWNGVNSEYCNFTESNKNCYMVFGGDFNEDCLHATFNFHCKNAMELYWVTRAELSYELTDSENCSRSAFGGFLNNCVDVKFGFDLNGCTDCFGSVNLRNQKYYYFGERKTPEEYKKLVGEMNLGSYRTLTETKERFAKERLKNIVRPYRIINSLNCTGDNIFNSKNVHRSFEVLDGTEDCRDMFLVAAGAKDSHSSSHMGLKSELVYNSMSIYPGSRIVGSWIVINGNDIYHSINCERSSNLFGCVGMKDKHYCILNKQYAKEEYEALVPKLIQHMKDMPYVDQKGRTYGYGEFFPPDLSPFAYNETVAIEYFPLAKEEALAKGYAWKDPEGRNYQVTMKNADIPDDIKAADENILKNIIECAHAGKCTEQCTTAFRMTAEELSLYQKMGVALPRLCPNCRHFDRLRKRNPLDLWHRKCQCAGTRSENGVYQNTVSHAHGDGHCPNEFESTYAPDRPEIVYCEECYQKEVS